MYLELNDCGTRSYVENRHFVHTNACRVGGSVLETDCKPDTFKAVHPEKNGKRSSLLGSEILLVVWTHGGVIDGGESSGCLHLMDQHLSIIAHLHNSVTITL